MATAQNRSLRRFARSLEVFQGSVAYFVTQFHDNRNRVHTESGHGVVSSLVQGVESVGRQQGALIGIGLVRGDAFPGMSVCLVHGNSLCSLIVDPGRVRDLDTSFHAVELSSALLYEKKELAVLSFRGTRLTICQPPPSLPEFLLSKKRGVSVLVSFLTVSAYFVRRLLVLPL